MQLLPFDYFTEKPAEGSGLIALVQNISDIRAKAGSGVFLFDNGDFLQGNQRLISWPPFPRTTPIIR
ncbi:MAG: hypothetical protein P8J00_05515 [Yoonia sp.]|nr:hypothetical protein [Yoonia sp.]